MTISLGDTFRFKDLRLEVIDITARKVSVMLSEKTAYRMTKKAMEAMIKDGVIVREED